MSGHGHGNTVGVSGTPPTIPWRERFCPTGRRGRSFVGIVGGCTEQEVVVMPFASHWEPSQTDGGLLMEM